MTNQPLTPDSLGRIHLKTTSLFDLFMVIDKEDFEINPYKQWCKKMTSLLIIQIATVN